MSFRSLYRHGFARVAACTTRTALADPASNAQSILRMARDCDRQAVALAVFPELGLSGYAISDLLQQTTLQDAVESAIGTLIALSTASCRSSAEQIADRDDPDRPSSGKTTNATAWLWSGHAQDRFASDAGSASAVPVVQAATPAEPVTTGSGN